MDRSRSGVRREEHPSHLLPPHIPLPLREEYDEKVRSQPQQEYDEKVLVEIYRSILAQGPIVSAIASRLVEIYRSILAQGPIISVIASRSQIVRVSCCLILLEEMTKCKHIQMTQSEDEYWTEPQSNSNQQAQCDEHAESSINSKSSTNINQEGDEVIIEDENGQRKRGKTKLADLWNLPRGHRVVVNCNTQGQPIGNEGGLLGQFLVTIARNGGICTLSHKDWRYVKKDAEKDIIAQGKFLYQARYEKWILKLTGRKWTDYKCDLKAAYFDEKASLKELYNLAPKDVIKDQWVYLVDFWKSNEGKAWSIRNRRNRTMLETTHTAGTKSFARVGEEMRQNHPQKKQP